MLPDKLKSGTRVRSPTGTRATVIRTALKDAEFDTPLYKLRYTTPYGVVTSPQLWTRDKLELAGVVEEEWEA